MRITFVAALLIMAGSGPAAVAAPRPRAPAILAVTADGDTCRFRWNDTDATPEQVTARTVAMLHADIARQGGPDNVEQLAPVHVHTDPQLPARCLFAALDVVIRAGVVDARIAVRPSGGQAGTPVRITFAIGEDAEPAAPSRHDRLRIDGGSLRWNGTAIDRLGLIRQLQAALAITSAPRLTVEVAPTTPCALLAPVLATLATTGTAPRFDLVESAAPDQDGTVIRIDMAYAIG